MPSNTIPGIPGSFTPEQAAANAAGSAFGSQMHDLAIRYGNDLNNPTPEAIQYYLDYASSLPNNDYGEALRKIALRNADYLGIASDGMSANTNNAPMVLKPEQVGGIVQFPEQDLQHQWDVYDLAKSQGKNPTEPATPRPAQRPANMQAFASWYRLIGQPIPEGTKEGPDPYIDPWSPGGKYNPTKPTVAPIQNPLATPTAPPIQIPPAIAAGSKPPVNTSPLLQALQNQSGAVTNPLVKPPTQSQAYNFDPAAFDPQAATVKMPDFVKNKPELGKNWGDLFSAVQSRYTS